MGVAAAAAIAWLALVLWLSAAIGALKDERDKMKKQRTKAADIHQL